MGVEITLVEAPSAEVRTAILTPLIAFNESVAGSARYEEMAATLRDEETGAVVGGLYGDFLYDWLFVALLVVPEALRGGGLGTRLMHQAEEFVRSRGGVGVWLDTFSFQARGFYERLGYQCFGELPAHPRGGSRLFMQKRVWTGSGEHPTGH